MLKNLKPETFFDLTSFEHANLFFEAEFVWEGLSHIYLHVFGRRFVLLFIKVNVIIIALRYNSPMVSDIY